jgi:hypothetical protein
LDFALGQLRNAFGRLTLPQNSLSFSEDLSEGKLHFTGVCLLIKHLTLENHGLLLETAAELKTEDQIAWWLSGLFPKKIPKEWENLTPLDGDQAKFQLIVDQEFVALLQRSREIHMHQFPSGSALAILKRALREDLKRNDPIERRKHRERADFRASLPHVDCLHDRIIPPRSKSHTSRKFA